MAQELTVKTLKQPTYHHADYELKRKFLRFLIKYIGFTLLAKIDHVEGIEKVPLQGPAILMINHIAFIDPILVLHLLHRNIVPLAKIEVYQYPLIGIFPKMWGVIPVRREEIDRQAIRQVFNVLHAGEIVLVAPEGTRGTQLTRGKVGVAYLASRAKVPVIPIAIENTPGFPALRNTPRWKGPGATVKFGDPFWFSEQYSRAGHDELRLMTDEAMYILAAMLPPDRRGVYSDLSQATRKTIKYA